MYIYIYIYCYTHNLRAAAQCRRPLHWEATVALEGPRHCASTRAALRAVGAVAPVSISVRHAVGDGGDPRAPHVGRMGVAARADMGRQADRCRRNEVEKQQREGGALEARGRVRLSICLAEKLRVFARHRSSELVLSPTGASAMSALRRCAAAATWRGRGLCIKSGARPKWCTQARFELRTALGTSPFVPGCYA